MIARSFFSLSFYIRAQSPFFFSFIHAWHLCFFSYLCIYILKEVEDRNVFEALFKSYYMQLFCFARGMVNDEEECRDIVGAAFEGVWKHFADIDQSTVKAYLYRSVRNNCINYLSRQHLEEKYADYYRAVTREVTTDEGIAEHEERMLRVKQVLGTMNETTREILTACYIDRKKYHEVASDRGISVSTVKKHMVKALRIIREANTKKA